MMTLFLGTGIRVSECVGLNLDDVDFKNAGIHIHRKGGKEVIIYFGDEVEEALRLYQEERKKRSHSVTVLLAFTFAGDFFSIFNAAI